MKHVRIMFAVAALMLVVASAFTAQKSNTTERYFSLVTSGDPTDVNDWVESSSQTRQCFGLDAAACQIYTEIDGDHPEINKFNTLKAASDDFTEFEEVTSVGNVYPFGE